MLEPEELFSAALWWIVFIIIKSSRFSWLRDTRTYPSEAGGDMKKSLGLLTLALVCVAVLGVLVRAAGLPLWAYGYTAPPPPGGSGLTCTAARPFGCARGAPPPDDGIVRHLPDSSGGFTLRQIANDYGPADWYPGDHPAMPDIVAHGREA
ncbi:MAG: hypothetical protein DMF92_11605, partial [Acidobacteria bacterium]